MSLLELVQECRAILEPCSECGSSADRLVFGICDECLGEAQEERYQLECEERFCPECLHFVQPEDGLCLDCGQETLEDSWDFWADYAEDR